MHIDYLRGLCSEQISSHEDTWYDTRDKCHSGIWYAVLCWFC